jgi:hypothetical protein
MVFFPRVMDKVAAALKIQQSFRSFRIRKFQQANLYRSQVIYPANEFCVGMALIQRRAALCISQWWKQMKLIRRIEALSVIRRYIK